jgi:MFS family permease
MKTNISNQKHVSDWARLRGFPRAVYVLVLGSFINRLGTFVLPYMALYLTQKGYSLSQTGWALSAWGLGNLFAGIIGGHLADTLGRRNTIVLSMAGSALMVIGLSVMNELHGFVLFAFFAALFTEIYRPAGHALVADLIPQDERVLVYALMRWAVNAGFAIGPALAGWLTQISYVWIFWIDAFTSLLFATVAWVFLPVREDRPVLPASHIFKAFSSLKMSAKTCFGDVRFIQIFVVTFLSAFAFLQSFTTLGLEVRSRGFTEVIFGSVLALNGGMIVLFEMPLSMWVRKQSPRLMMIVGYALIGLGFGLFAFGNGLFNLFLGMFVMTIGEMIALPVALGYVSSMAPDHMRGRYMGMWGFSWALAMTVSTAGGLKMLESLGSEFWIYIGLMGFLSALIMSFKIQPKPTVVLTEAKEA